MEKIINRSLLGMVFGLIIGNLFIISAKLSEIIGYLSALNR